jgi:DNA repair protein RadD
LTVDRKRLDSVLRQIDEITLQTLLPKGVVGILNNLDSALARPSNLRRLIVESDELSDRLSDPEVVRELILGLPRNLAVEIMSDVLDEPINNPYSHIDDLQIRSGSRDLKRLLEQLGVEPTEDPPAHHSPPVVITTPEYGLYDHQRQAVRDCWSIVDSGKTKFLVHMPTGSGKTRTAIHFAAEMLRNKSDGVVLWIANSEELCEQAASEFERAWSYIGNRGIKIGRFWGSYSDQALQIRDGVMIAGVQKLHSLFDSNIQDLLSLSSHTNLLIFDEAHQIIAPTYRRLVQLLTDYNPKVVLAGLSATPGRSWLDIDADEELSSFFDRTKVSLRPPGGENPVEFLIREQYLADSEFESLFYESGFELSRRDLKAIADATDMPRSLLDRIGQDRARNVRIVQRVEQLVREHSRILLFAPSVESSKLLAFTLRARGIDSVSIDGTTPSGIRQDGINKLRTASDTPFVLTNYGVATTGVDVPNVSCAVIARPTKSLVLFSQMVGRAIRGPRVGGNSHATIVSVVDQHLPGFRNVQETFLNWEDVWE